MIKRTDAVQNWILEDSTRSPDNVIDDYLFADTSGAEGIASSVSVDFLSNGFKWRGASGHVNLSGGNYIFLAFAEMPFKHSNAR